MIKEIKNLLYKIREEAFERYSNFDSEQEMQTEVGIGIGAKNALRGIKEIEKHYAQPLTAEWLRENGKRWGFVENATVINDFSRSSSDYIFIGRACKAIVFLSNGYGNTVKLNRKITIGEFLNIIDLLQFEEEEI